MDGARVYNPGMIRKVTTALVAVLALSIAGCTLEQAPQPSPQATKVTNQMIDQAIALCRATIEEVNGSSSEDKAAEDLDNVCDARLTDMGQHDPAKFLSYYNKNFPN